MPEDDLDYSVTEMLERLCTSEDWQFYGYPRERLADEDGIVSGCYRTPPAPTG